MKFNDQIGHFVGASAKRSGARINTSCTLLIMNFDDRMQQET